MEVTDSNIEAPSGTAEVGDIPQSEPVEAVSSEEPAGSADLYTVKVDGQDHQVSLEELQSGYSRQQDYTKKTQEVADMRKRLQSAEALAAAMDKDPIGTLQALNEHFGVGSDEGTSWDDMDPQEQRLARLEGELQDQRAREVRNEIENDFRTLTEAFGDFDRREVTNFAIKNNLGVVDAYKVMNFESLRSERERLAQETKVLDQKRNLPQSHGGTQRNSTLPSTEGKKMSIRESYQAALKQVSTKQ